MDAIDLTRTPPGQTRHPSFIAPVIVVHGEQHAHQVRVQMHARGVRVIPAHYREMPRANDAHYAPPTNSDERDWLPGGKASY